MIFISLDSLIYILDFGFYATFSRNITYIFSGANSLQKEGIERVEPNSPINYSLLKGLLGSIKKVYGTISLFMVLIFLSFGTLYINKLLTGYSGNHTEAVIAWYLYGLLLCYRFFTYYYDALLIGRGMIKRSRQIFVASQSLHMVVATLLLLTGYGIISMVIGQILSTILNRFLAHRSFYDKKTSAELKKIDSHPIKELLKTLWPNVYKTGISSISSVLLKNIIPLAGGLFIPLSLMGSYGVSKNIVDITFSLGMVWFMTYYPKLTKERSHKNDEEVKRLFIKGQYISFIVFTVITICTLLFGNEALIFIKKDASLVAIPLMALYFTSSFLDSITDMSTKVILSRNEVPYYKSQFITACISIISLILMLQFAGGNVAFLIAIPFTVQLAYQHWKWYSTLVKELKIKFSDYIDVLRNLLRFKLL